MDTTFYALASKVNFNKALNHFFMVNDVVDEIEERENLADFLNELLEEKELVTEQVLPIVSSVLKDKYNYSYKSFEMPATREDFSKVIEETSSWTGLDLVAVYFNQNSEPVLINPANPIHWNLAGKLAKDHLVVVYAKYLKSENRKIEDAAIKALFSLINGKKIKTDKNFIDVSVKKKVLIPEPVIEEKSFAVTSSEQPVKKMKSKNCTPKYSVQVTNELFHNGNVEAWKKILESYNVTYSHLKVAVFYEDELINDINTLFKWGKVKHGGLIFFQVFGDDIKGVSKLRKYLFEGASPRFEQFLKVAPGQVLKLF